MSITDEELHAIKQKHFDLIEIETNAKQNYLISKAEYEDEEKRQFLIASGNIEERKAIARTHDKVRELKLKEIEDEVAYDNSKRQRVHYEMAKDIWQTECANRRGIR